MTITSDPQDAAAQGGDRISIGDIKDATGVAVGHGARATVYQGLSVEEVAALLVELKHKDQPTVWDGRTPYLGLNAFQESDAAFFFGREALVDDLLARVGRARFVTIAGPSGSGKSSVARAGLFYALRQGRLARSDTWLMATMQPKGDPLQQLALALERLIVRPGAADSIRQHGLQDALALHTLAETLLSDDKRQRLVLLVDQFEELFTQTKEEKTRAAFIDLLAAAAQEADGRVTVAVSLRSDFVSNCARYADLRELLSHEFQLVGAMAPRDLAKAITLPALEVGAAIAPDLVKQIIDDMKGEPGALPLMSFALLDLFEAERTSQGEPMGLTREEYLQRGGIESALERHANQVFASFSTEQQDLARVIFAALIEVGQGQVDTRRTATFDELVPDDASRELVAATVAALAEEDARLITTSGVERGEDLASQNLDHVVTVTIAHEKLIDAWPWLRRLVDENRDVIKLQNDLAAAARTWETNARDDSYLYSGARLATVEEQVDAGQLRLAGSSSDFVSASIARREAAARTRRLVMIGLAALTVVAVVAALFAFTFAGRASDNADQAEANLQTAEAEKQRAEAQTTRAVGAEQHALEAQEQAEANAALAAANLTLAQTREAEAEAARIDAEEQARLALARQLLAESGTVLGLDYELLYRSTLLAVEAARRLVGLNLPSLEADLALRQNLDLIPRRIASLDCSPHSNQYRDSLFSADGRYLIAACEVTGVKIWDVASREVVAEVPEADLELLALSPDGRFVASALDYGGNDGTLAVFDVQSAEEIFNTAYDGPAEHLAVSKDGAYLALSNNFDDVMHIWQLSTGEEVAAFAQDQTVYDLLFSPLDQTLLVATNDRVSMIAVDALEEGSSLVDAGQFISACIQNLSFSPDDQFLAGGDCRDGRIRIWDFAQQRLVSDLSVAGRPRNLAVSPGGRYAANVDGRTYDVVTQIIDVTSEELFNLDTAFNAPSLAFSPTGDILSVSGTLWQLESYTHLAAYRDEQDILDVVFSEDEQAMTVISGQGQDDQPEDGSGAVAETAERAITLHTIPLGGTEGALSPAGEMVASASTFSANGQRTAAADVDGTIAVLDGQKQETVATLEAGGPVESLTLSADGQQLAVASGGHLILWDIEANEQVINESYEGTAHDIAFANPGVYLVTLETYCAQCGTRGQRQVWNAYTYRYPGGEAVWHLPTEGVGSEPPPEFVLSEEGGYWANAFSVDGQRRLTVVNLSAGRQTDEISHPESSFSRFAISANGKYLATDGQDETVRVWETTNGREIARVPKPGDAALDSLAISPGGRYLATVSGHELQLWALSLQDLAAEACARLPRNLTWAEWENHLDSERYAATCPDIPLKAEELLAAARAYALDGRRDFAGETYALAAQAVAARENAFLADRACREGSTAGFVAIVAPACDQAVELVPTRGAYRDSRGIARALSGDYEGAIEDFQYYIDELQAAEEPEQYAATVQTRRSWIDALQAGRNPLNEATLARLLSS